MLPAYKVASASVDVILYWRGFGETQAHHAVPEVIVRAYQSETGGFRLYALYVLTPAVEISTSIPHTAAKAAQPARKGPDDGNEGFAGPLLCIATVSDSVRRGERGSSTWNSNSATCQPRC